MSENKKAKSEPESAIRPVGRPTQFTEAVSQKIIDMAADGKTDQQIAQFIGVHVNTLRKWKKRHEEFGLLLNDTKEQCDELVELSLFNRAIGFAIPEVKVFYDSKTGQTVEHVVKKYYPPDVTAAIFWLKNRKPREWRDKHEVETSGSTKVEHSGDSQLVSKLLELAANVSGSASPGGEPSKGDSEQ